MMPKPTKPIPTSMRMYMNVILFVNELFFSNRHTA